MRSIRTLFTGRQGRSARRTAPVTVVAAAGAALALTLTACGPGDDDAGGDPSPEASASQAGDGGSGLPGDIADRLREHGIDIDKWKNGGWQNWDKDKWLREAQDFVNPIIAGLWDPDRMRDADPPDKGVDDNDVSGDQGVTDPAPSPVTAAAVSTPYHRIAPYTGKLFFDAPEGHMVCSATIVKDPAHPGKSNLVWTAGHCVHAGASGGWYRNIAFVPSYNDNGKSAAALEHAPRNEIAPYGIWWGQWAQTSGQWIEQGGPTGGRGAPYDFAVIHVTPEKGSANKKSLEETVGAALPVNFNAPAVSGIKTLTAQGYPAAKPFDGQKLYQCSDKPGRLSLSASAPTMYRIGCTMTAGSSGGGWIGPGEDGKPALVSNTSIGPITNGWLAGPRFGKVAEGVYGAVSEKYADR